MSNVCDIPGSGSQNSSATSRSLLARVQANEDRAWERLVELYAPLVFHWCRSSGLQEQDAADVLQEVFRAIVTHVGAFRRDQPGHTFRGWLHRITRNKVHDHYRRLGRDVRGVGGSSARDRLLQQPAAEPADESAAPDDGEAALFGRALEMIRGDFSEQTWLAFWRTAVDGLPAKDVAAELSSSPGAVRVARCRVVRRLRQELGDFL